MTRGWWRSASLLALLAVFATTGCADQLPVPTGPGQDGDDPPGQEPPDNDASVAPSLPVVFVDGLQSPLRLVSVPGGVLATDSKLGMVLQIDPMTMEYSRGIQIRGKPLAIGYSGHLVYVGNASRRTIEVYDGRGGSFVRNFGVGKVRYPSDMAIDRHRGVIYVVDAGRKIVRVFDVSGDDLGSISGPGHGPCALANPTGIAVDRGRREILVSDYGPLDGSGHASIKIFSFEGAFVDEISGEGSCLNCVDGFSRPQGLAIGQDGHIYVADALLGSVLIFARDSGQLVNRLGSDGYLRLPTDVAVGADGDLYIANNLGKNFRQLRRGAAR